MKILIVDDDRELRRIAVLSLAALGGMTVVEADSGEQGLALAAQEAPDGILLDVNIPDMDGPAILEALRQNPATASIPVIFLTASTRPQDREKLQPLHPRGILAKPFDVRSLAADVRRLLETPDQA